MARRIGGNPRKTRVTPFAAPPLLLLDGTIDVKQSSPLASGGPVTSLSATFSAMPKAGSAIVVQVAAYEETSYNALVAGDCTDNQGNTYSLAFVQADPDAGANDARSSIAVFYVFDIPAPTGTAFTVTIGRPGTNNWFARARIHEVTGIDTLDATATETASGTSTSPTVTTGTPANADSIMFGVLSTDDGSSDTGIDLPSEWLTEWRDNDGSAIVSSMAAHKTINSATAQTYSGGALTASESWAIGVAVFSPSAANYELTITKVDEATPGVIAQQWAEAIQRYKAELEAEERERQEKSSIAPTPEGARSSPEAPQTSPTEAQTIKRAASLAVEQGIKARRRTSRNGLCRSPRAGGGLRCGVATGNGADRGRRNHLHAYSGKC